jgi:hypothetical protein
VSFFLFGMKRGVENNIISWRGKMNSDNRSKEIQNEEDG